MLQLRLALKMHRNELKLKNVYKAVSVVLAAR